MSGGSPRILIVRLSAIGDVVRVLPALQLLRRELPDARIDWAIEPKSAGIVEDHPALDELLVFERPPGRAAAARAFLGFCRKIRARRYDTVLDFHGIFKSGFVTGFSGARRRYGFAPPRSRELSSLFYTHTTRLSSKRMNRVEENVILCEAFLPQRGPIPSPTIYVSEEVQESVDAFFDHTFDGGKRVVAIHAPVDRPEKQWPLRHYAELADTLVADGRFEVTLTWGPGQRDIAAAVLRMCRRNPHMAPEIPDLKHYAWFINRADLYIGGDTGPMHIAAAMGTPVVAVFGGTDPAKHTPYRAVCEVLGPPEGAGSLAAAQEALAAISAEQVYDACVRVLARARV